MIFVCPTIARADDYSSITDDWSVAVNHDGAKVDQVVQWEDGSAYLFLPAGADLSAVVLSNTSDTSYKLNGRSFRPEKSLALSTVAKGANTSSWNVPVADAAGTRLFTLNVRRSENIAGMYLTSDDPVTYGRGFVEAVKGNEASGSMTMVNADGSVVYDGDLKQIKGRGNSTWKLNKKPYQIKLDKKTDLLQTGSDTEKNKTWVLLANGYDPTLMRNYLAYNVALESGLNGSVGCRFVDLWYDGEYRGNYLLCEKVQVGTGRIDIDNMDDANEAANPDAGDLESLPTEIGTNKYGMQYCYTPGIASPSNVEGGYLFELDGYYYAEKAWFSVNVNGATLYFTSKNPGAWSKEEAEYLSCRMQEAMDKVVTNQDISEVLDAKSYAEAYWNYELSKNNDALTFSSTYFYIPGNGDSKIYAGPVWDFDRGLGNYAKSLTYSSPSGLLACTRGLGAYMNVNDQIRAAEDEAYESCKGSFDRISDDSNPNGFTQALATVSTSAKLNNILWWDERWYQRWDTYEQATAYLGDWVAKRSAWFDTYDRGRGCVSLNDAQVTMENDHVGYNGKTQKPAVKVTYNGKTLKEGSDYELYYTNAKNLGTATVSVVGINGFKDTVTTQFQIIPAATKLKQIDASTSGLAVSWSALKSSYSDGYQVRYATSSSMKGAKTLNISGASKASATIKGLKSGSTYYVQVRSCKKVGEETQYSDWTKAVKAKAAKASGSVKVSKVSAKSKGLKAYWSVSKSAKPATFEVRYSTSKSMKSATVKTVKSKSARSLSVTKLKGGKTYYVQVRMHQTDGVVKYVSSWSSPVKVTTKK
ncbi:MAG: CotH kinase family protein [Eggerthellaceae bacterium]